MPERPGAEHGDHAGQLFLVDLLLQRGVQTLQPLRREAHRFGLDFREIAGPGDGCLGRWLAGLALGGAGEKEDCENGKGEDRTAWFFHVGQFIRSLRLAARDEWRSGAEKGGRAQA